MTKNNLPPIAIYADGADSEKMFKLEKLDYIKGFTTNPSLLKKHGVSDYRGFALDLLKTIKKPISFEIFADDDDGMIEQAMELSSWADNVYVKVPIMNSQGVSTKRAIIHLHQQGVKLNITAIFTAGQVADLIPHLAGPTHVIFSIFAGRIADTGIDPMPIVKETADIVNHQEQAWRSLLWAGTRQVYSAVEAQQAGCDIITLPYDMIDKLPLFGKDLLECSKQAVVNFYQDAQASKLYL